MSTDRLEASSTGRIGRWLRACRSHPARTTLAALALLCAVALVFADALLAEPMRWRAERAMNAALNGYTVRIGRARPHLWRLGFDLDDLVLAQNSHPQPPVADFGALKFTVLWHELLAFRLAGNLTLERPALHINLVQLEEEAASKATLKERGWQAAIEAVYPIKLSRVKIQDGSLVYLANGTAGKPLQLTRVTMLAENVRNLAVGKGTYPSPVTLEGTLFDTGKVAFKGEADFLRTPSAAARGKVSLVRVPLDRLDPIAQDYQLKTTGGLLSLDGSVEYTPEVQSAHLHEVLVEGLQVDYVTTPATKAIEKRHGREAEAFARKVRNAPRLLLQMDSLKLRDSQIGFVNGAARPSYRLFLSKVDFELKNLSNQKQDERSTFQARGAFMGSGTTEASGGFRATAATADYNVHLQMDDARLVDLNPFLRAATGVDAAGGRFSLYSEIKVKDGRIDGYLKPLVKDLKIYDRAKDKDKPFGKRVEMHVLQFLGGLFRNHGTKDVATVATLSGSTGDPRTGQWAAIRKLIGNGFAHAVLPGFLDKTKAPAPPPKTPKKAEK